MKLSRTISLGAPMAGSRLALPNAQRILYPDSGHGALFQYPERFVNHVKQFLAESNPGDLHLAHSLSDKPPLESTDQYHRSMVSPAHWI